jgi:hypothetical protein
MDLDNVSCLDYSEDLGIHGRIILTCNIKNRMRDRGQDFPGLE